MEPDRSFSTSFTVDNSPQEVFDAINNVRGWWSEEVEGRMENVGDVFTYHYQDVHRCQVKVVDSIPGEKVVWRILENEFSFIRDKTEWVDTTIEFALFRQGDKTLVRFTHIGLVLEYECYEVCANAWTSYVSGSLKNLIATGRGQPNVKSAEDHSLAGSFTTSFTVDKTPQQVYDAITDVRSWWSGEILGDTSELGDEFSYRFEDLHFSKQKVTELVPGKKVVWHVVDASLSFARNPSEWKGTHITFGISPLGDRTEVSFTHHGLVPGLDCYEDCSSGWRFYVNGSLHNFISGGKSTAIQEAR